MRSAISGESLKEMTRKPLGLLGTMARIQGRRAFSLLLTMSCCLLVTACNDDDSTSRGGASSVQSGGSSPKFAPARATVFRLWSEIASGSPSLTSEYDPRLVRLLGSNLMLTVFDVAPPEYSAPPRMKEVRQVSSGVLIRVEGKGPGQEEPIPVSFLVSKVNQQWLIRYDSNLLNRIRGEIQAQVLRGLPRTEATLERASALANRAVLEARALFAKGPRKGTLPPP